MIMRNLPTAFRLTVFFAYIGSVLAISCFAGAQPSGEAKNHQYEIGGPLEGWVLPLAKTQHGEAPGYPGVLPGKFSNEGVYPEFELFPGSVERYHTYSLKFFPSRSMLDGQSLLRNWKATELAGNAGIKTEDYAAPVYWIRRYEEPQFTGVYNAPVPVVRAAIDKPIFKLDLGELPVGMYCLKTVGAVETRNIQQARKALYYTVSVNDGLNGETNTYRQRVGYVDEFFSVSEVYFHATTRRHYTAEIKVDAGSRVDLLISNIELHDVLVGSQFRPIKKHMTLTDPAQRVLLRAEAQKNVPQTNTVPRNPTARLERDASIWNNFPRINYQSQLRFMGYGTDARLLGAGGMTPAEIQDKYGAWVCTRFNDYPALLMENKKLGLTYSMQDAAMQKPLPAPYPFPDDGAGVQTPASKPDGEPLTWSPIADANFDRVVEYLSMMHQEADEFEKYGDAETGRDGALRLLRFAYDLPSSDAARMLQAVIEQPGGFGRDGHSRWRETNNIHLDSYSTYPRYLDDYDKLYDIIATDPQLPVSVSRFVPWVKTNADLIELLDVYLVQHFAKRVLRYQWFTSRTGPLQPATTLGDNSVTEPWMKWLFSKTFIYPLPPSGLQDILVTGYDRSGAQWIGSTFYQQSNAAYTVAAELESYIRGGGEEKYNLSDPKVNPKPLQSCYWQYQILVGGLQFLRIGDVTGPDKYLNHTWTDVFDKKTRLGWEWSKDPKFAFLIAHYFGRKTESDSQWREIEAAAAKCKRAPFLESKSRVLPMWASILESGTQHDDFRFRRASYLRVGQGWGHHHNDTLDLQIVAHGLPMTLDGGQRPGYSKPDDRSTRVHNVVEVDGQEMLAHSWVNALSDVNGARYTRATLVPPSNLPQLKHYSRQIALIDVDEGEGSKPLPPEMTQPSAKLPPVARTANSYTFDVVRVSGGKRHTYAFHGPVADPDMPQPTTNAKDITDIPGETAGASARVKEAAEYLDNFWNHKYCGIAPENFEATFPIPKNRASTEGLVGAGTEAKLMGPSYDPQSPDKYLKLHLLGVTNAMVMKGDENCRQWKYFIPHVFVQQQDAQLDAPFAAVIEPYEGKPFISSTTSLPITGNEKDPLRAVAAKVETTNGHHDICFADGRPSQVRVVGGASPLRVAGEFAYLSHDDEGLRQASLTGGKILSCTDILIQPQNAERIGRVVKTDYPNRRLWLNNSWPVSAAQGGVFEIGTPEKHTEYTAVAVNSKDGKSVMQLDAGADFYQSRVRDVDAKTGTVICGLGFSNLDGDPQPGQTKGWVASNDSLTKFWRAEYLGGSRDEGRFRFKLTGAPVSAEDFGKDGALRLWEYGVGDSVRQSTFVGVRRIGKDLYEVQTNVACRIGLRSKALKFSTDGRSFKSLPTTREGSLLVAAIGDAQIGARGKVWLRSAS